MGMRAREQKALREDHVRFVGRKLARRLMSEEEQTRMHSTNRLFPMGGIRCHCVRRLFSGWIRKYAGNGRVFTRKLSDQVCASLRRRFGLDPDCGDDEGQRLHRLLKTARKRKLSKRRPLAMPLVNPDETPTLPLDYEDRPLEPSDNFIVAVYDCRICRRCSSLVRLI